MQRPPAKQERAAGEESVEWAVRGAREEHGAWECNSKTRGTAPASTGQRQSERPVRRTNVRALRRKGGWWEEKISSRIPTNRKHGRFALAEFLVAR